MKRGRRVAGNVRAGRKRPQHTAARRSRAGVGARRTKAASSTLAVPAATKQIEAIRRQIERVAGARPPRWNADPAEVRRAVLKLVLTLVELIRQLLERQAIRRMEAGTLSDDETEAVGLALMRLQETIAELAKQFDIPLEELNLDLGPVGKLL